MKSKNEEEYKPLRTKHEEIMYCIESTNEIVSKILEKLDEKTWVITRRTSKG